MRAAIIILCFFLSGAAALVYEVAWIRQASLVFGSTTLALSTVLAVFFLGLAVGSEIFGRLVLRIARPLRWFAALELALALLALASPHAFEWVDSLYTAIYPEVAEHGAARLGLRAALVAIVLLPSTILMGGTLPLFCRQFVKGEGRIAGWVGLLYGVNTLGAAAGAAAAGLVLLPAIGLRDTIAVGAACNAVAGITVAVLWHGAPRPASVAASVASAARARIDPRVATLFFLAGFVAIGSQVLWARYLGLLVRNTVHSYTLILVVVLVGIVLGSLLAGALSNRARDRAFSFGSLQVAIGLVMLALMLAPPSFWRGLGERLGVYALLLLPAAILSGASFPVGVRMVVSDPSWAGRAVGRLVALNTLGGIVGSLAIGFAGLPVFGMQRSLLFLSGASLLVGCAAWLALARSIPLSTRCLATLAAAALWLALPNWLGTQIPADHLAGPGEELVAHREGWTSNLAVLRNHQGLQLEIDRWWQGGERKSHQAVAAHVPMLLHPDPKTVLVVGAGAGQTPSRFLLYGVERLDCVDIEPVVFDVIRSHFDGAWMDDARVRVVRDDGRSHVAHTARRYDVISLEVGQTFRPGVAFFYTVEFYQLARERLEPGGLLVQFVPTAFLTPEAFRGVVASFLDAFPQSLLWYNTSELLLVGVRGDHLALHPRLELPARDARVRADLDYAHWGGADHRLSDPVVFLSGFLLGPSGLAELISGAPVFRDDRPVLDHATADVAETETRELAIVSLLAPRLEPIETSLDVVLAPGQRERIRTLRTGNLGEMAASALLRRATLLRDALPLDELVRLLREAVDWNGNHAIARRLLGDALVLRGEFAEARSHYEHAIRIAPDDFRSRQGLGVALLGLDRIGPAAHHLREAVRLRPDDAEAHNQLGVALARQGYPDVAVHHFEEALRLRPGDRDAERNLARLRAATRER